MVRRARLGRRRRRPPPRRAAARLADNGRPARRAAPRRTSSCSLVSSRATAAGRSPSTSAMSARPAASRDGAFEEHQGRLERRQPFKRAAARRLARRQKAGKQKGIGRQPRQDQRGQRRRRAGSRRHRQFFGDRRAHELVAGVGDERRSGVARPAPPARRGATPRGSRAAPLGVVVVIELERRSDPVAGEQPRGNPGVLAKDAVDTAQHRQRPQGDVAEIADRRGDEIETRRESSGSASAGRQPAAAGRVYSRPGGG